MKGEMAVDGFVRQLVERAPVVGFVKDQAGTYLYVNDAWRDLFGVRPSDVIGRTDFDIFPRRIAEGFLKNDQIVFTTGRSIEVTEQVIIHGHERTYLASKFPLVCNGLVALGGIAVDVSASEQSRSELVRSELRFRRLVEHSPEAIVVFDAAQGVFVDVNENACRLFELSRDELLKSSPADLSPSVQPDGRKSLPLIGEYLQQALSGAYPVFDWIHLNGSGNLIPCRIWLSKMDEDGAPWVRASILDGSEIDHARRALDNATLQLDRARRLESLGRLAGGVAHDFNNLLTIMVGSLHFLEEFGPLPPEVQDELVILRDATQQARGLTRQLLTFAREPTGLAQAVDIDKAVTQTMGTLTRLVGEDVRLISTLGAGGARVWIDPGQLDQIILNLVVNAREAIEPGGDILVETLVACRRCAARPELGGANHGDHGSEFERDVVLVVTDDGRGMSPEIREKAFDPFFSTKGIGRGTGLGLSTVYGIVQAAGGQATIESRSGKGTSIRVCLPRFLGETRRASERTPEEGADEGCILVIEDEAAVRRVTTRVLSWAGYRVLEAGTPGEAMEAAGREGSQIDLIVSDVVMPEMNGLELAEHLRPLIPGVPVLYVSGYPADALSRVGVLDEVDLLAKPFTAAELLDQVRKLLKRRDGEAQRS